MRDGGRTPLWLRLAWLETMGNKGFSASFVLSLALGLIGFLLLDAFKESVGAHLEERSKGILGADLALTSRRPLDDAETSAMLKELPAGTRMRRETSLLSMGSVGSASRLVEVRAVDAEFPYYGDFRLRDTGPVASSTDKAIVSAREAWVAPELLLQLEAKIGDELAIGEARFRIADVVEQDPSLSTSGTALAPRVYVGQAFVAETGLVALGSRVTHAALVRLPPPATEAEALAPAVKRALKTSDIRVRTHRSASEELNRLLIYLNDYLGLVALVALFLSALGAAFLYRSFLGRRTKDIAILLSVGASLGLARGVYLTQLLILGAAATALTTLLAWGALPLLPVALGKLLPEGMPLAVPPVTLALALALGTGGAVLFCLPLLLRIGSIKPATLFQEAAAPRLDLSRRAALGWLPALICYWLLAVWQAHSLKTGSLFVGLFLGSGLVLALVCLGLLKLLGRAHGRGAVRTLVFEMAALNLARHRAATLACFLAVSLGALLLNLVPQVRTVLNRELDQPQGDRLPSLFLIDIQDEQVEPLKGELARLGTELKFISPLVRARLASLKGEAIKSDDDAASSMAQTREDERESRMQNRGYNLSYREGLAPSEELVSGRPLGGRYDPDSGKLPEVSLEVGFAERVGLGLGDKVAFDVQGVAVEGQVVNLRRVRWTSFQPNFFVSFQPGVLDEAPKSFLAAIPAMPLEEKVRTQSALVRAFPNVSIIDVGNTVARILDIIAQISAAMTFMALLSLVAGVAVLFSIASHQAQQRLRDTTLLKILGASFEQLRGVALVEYGLLGLAAAGLGAAVSVGVSYALSTYLFDSAWVFAWQVPLLSAGGIVALCVTTGMAATGRALRAKPAALLSLTASR